MMENMDKGLTVPKWMLINRPKIPQIPQNLSVQAQKFGISVKKGFIWASVVRDYNYAFLRFHGLSLQIQINIFF